MKIDVSAGRLLLRVLSIGICLITWHFASTLRLDLGVVSFRNVPAPFEVAGAAWDLLHSSKLMADIGASLG